jgi:HEAT repeat protein
MSHLPRTIAEVTLLAAQGEEALPRLCTALHHRKEDIRRAAAWALGQVASASALPDLLAALYDPDTLVRRNVLSALAKIGDPVALPRLSGLLMGEADPLLHAEAALTLGILLASHPSHAEAEQARAALARHLESTTPLESPKFAGQTLGQVCRTALGG